VKSSKCTRFGTVRQKLLYALYLPLTNSYEVVRVWWKCMRMAYESASILKSSLTFSEIPPDRAESWTKIVQFYTKCPRTWYELHRIVYKKITNLSKFTRTISKLKNFRMTYSVLAWKYETVYKYPILEAASAPFYISRNISKIFVYIRKLSELFV